MARDELGGEEYWVPECVRAYLGGGGVLDQGTGGHGAAR